MSFGPAGECWCGFGIRRDTTSSLLIGYELGCYELGGDVVGDDELGGYELGGDELRDCELGGYELANNRQQFPWAKHAFEPLAEF